MLTSLPHRSFFQIVWQIDTPIRNACQSERCPGTFTTPLARCPGSLGPMWRHLGAIGTLATAATLWPACTGEEFFHPDGKIDCSTTAQCENGKTGLMCIDDQCLCPGKGDVFCCDKASETTGDCNRQCRPVAACGGVKTPCQSPNECRGLSHADPRCESISCEGGFCQARILKVAATQREGDCTLVRCNEKGETYDEAAPDDVFNDGNQCTDDKCDGSKILTASHDAGEAPESSGFCDGKGHWVGCLRDEDCGSPSYGCSKSGTCVFKDCVDGVFDAPLGETATDCGGSCDPCAAGQPCKNGNDCVEQYCEPTGLCAPARCDDHKQNGAETGVDCGAPSCEPCESGSKCNTHDDCQSGVCTLGRCAQATCKDGVMNGAETGIDCGGGCEMRCAAPMSSDESQ